MVKILFIFLVAACKDPAVKIKSADEALAFPSPSAFPSPTPSATSSPIPFALVPGLNIQLNHGARVDKVQEAGFQWVRINLAWCIAERVRGEFDFSEFDKTISNAERLGLKILGGTGCTPSWASPGGLESAVPNVDDWKNYVRKIAQRYKNRLHAISFWNEPNLSGFWAGTAEQYINIHKSAAQIFRADAPSVLITGPDLAHLYSATISLENFFQALKNAHYENEIDVFSHHVYGGSDFEQKFTGFFLAGLLYKKGLKQYLEAASLWDKKPIWITEFGANEQDVGENNQAQHDVEQFKVMNRLGWIEKAFLFELDDNHTQNYRYGILTKEGVPKKAFFEIKNFLTQD